MKSIRFDADSPDVERHECESFRDGEWLVFHCPRCPMYERRIHERTGQMVVRQADDVSIRHYGVHRPKRVDHHFFSVN